MANYLRPSELDLQRVSYAIDYDTLPRFRDEEGDVRGDHRNTFRSGFLQRLDENQRSKTVLLEIEGELTTPGIQSKTFKEGEPAVESFGVRVVDPKDVAALEQLWDMVMPVNDPEAEHWRRRELFHNNNTIFFKAKPKRGGEAYVFNSNRAMRPNDENAACLELAQPVHVRAQMSAYYAVDDPEPTCGVYFTLKEFLVGDMSETERSTGGPQTLEPQPSLLTVPAGNTRKAARGRTTQTR